jgi:predicted aspartyl protease/tetratricopeptide (TPR) repeat protein
MKNDRSSAGVRGVLRLVLPLLAAAFVGLAPRAAWSANCKLQTFEVPVRMVGSRPIATVGLNGTEVPMLVDSGAFFSFLTEPAAKQLDLRLRMLPDHLRIYGYTGLIDGKVARVNKVQFNGVEIPNVEFIVGVNELGAGIQGVLGRNFLAMADTEYDLAHGVVRLVFPKGDCDSVDFAYWAGKDAPVNVVPLVKNSRKDDAIHVSARVNGEKVSAIMDTGAGLTTMLLRAARRAGIKEADMTPMGRASGAGAGHARAWLAPVATFELGGEKISNNRLEVDDADGLDEDMLIGIDYFLSHRIYVSRLQGKVYATWNGGAVFALNKTGNGDDARFAAAPEAVSPEDADALARSGEAALSRGDFAHALEDLDRACALSPQTARYFFSRARVYAAMRQPAKALADLDEALRLDPAMHQALKTRAYLRAGLKDRAGALADLQALDTALPASAHARVTVGEVYEHLDMAPEALHQWDLWVASHGNDAGLGGVLNKRCWLRARLKLELQRALEDCRQAVKEDDENASFQDSLGWTYLRLDDPSRALKAFDQAVKLRTASPWSYYGRAQAQRRLGHAEAAQRDLASSRKLDPHIDDKVKRAGFDVEPGAAEAPPPASAPAA